MNAARRLADRGLHAEALSEYLWCFDHGHVEDPGFGGVRVSFLLGYMQKLAQKYPAAMQALRERRDAAESRVLEEADDRTSVVEFAQISADLGEPERSLALFERLLERADRPMARKELLRFVLPLCVDAKRYGAVMATADPLEVVGSLVRDLTSHIGWLRGDPKTHEGAAGLTDYLRMSFVEEAADYFEVLLGSGREEEARVCAEQIIDAHPTGESYATLIAHAVHSEAMSAARTLARRGLETLPKTERAVVAEAAERIPPSPAW